MPLSGTSSQDTLQPLTSSSISSSPPEHRRYVGRYVAGGATLAVTLLILYHVLLRDASPIAGICIPTIIMTSYIIWVIYSAHRDKLKARRLATVMQQHQHQQQEQQQQQQQLTEVMSSSSSSRCTSSNVPRDTNKVGMSEAIRATLEGNSRMTSVQGRPVMLSSTKASVTATAIQENFNRDRGSIT